MQNEDPIIHHRHPRRSRELVHSFAFRFAPADLALADRQPGGGELRRELVEEGAHVPRHFALRHVVVAPGGTAPFAGLHMVRKSVYVRKLFGVFEGTFQFVCLRASCVVFRM